MELLTGAGNDGYFTSAPALVTLVCNNWQGVAGGVLAILGVVAAPLTSGDTALRSARLIIADFLKLSMFALWTITVYLVRHKKCFWITLIPALFMTTVCTTFFFLSKQMSGLPEAVAYPLGIACLIVACVWFAVWYRKESHE